MKKLILAATVLSSLSLPAFAQGKKIQVMPETANFAELGYTAWGVTVTSLELVNSAKVDLSFEQAAGIVGVFVAVVVVKNPMVVDFIAGGISDVPAFPIEAALIGLGAATFVGALAGLLPALVAVRVKVIDAIRY